MRRDTWSNTQRSWLQTGIPFTVALMVAKFISLFLISTPSLAPFYIQLSFLAPGSLVHPWTLLTYPLLSHLPFLSFLFDIGLTYWFCGSLERSWGPRIFAIFFVAMSVVSALSLSLGAFLFRSSLYGIDLLPVAAAAVAWGVINAEERVTLYFIPMRGIHVAVLAVLYVMFEYVQAGTWLAVPFALLGCGAAYLWLHYQMTYRLEAKRTDSWSAPIGKPKLKLVLSQTNKPVDDRFSFRDLNPFEWLARKRRRKQFEKLMRDD